VSLAVGELAQAIAADAKVTLDEEPAPVSRPARPASSVGNGILMVILVIFLAGFSFFGCC